MSNSPLLLELFCGSAGVCAQFRLAGGRALGIDHNWNRSKLKAAAVKLDLNEQGVRDLIVQEIDAGRVHAIHMGPPCGTSSKARNIPIKKHLLKSGAPRPQPLRSAAHPDGYPWLRGVNKLKVQAANRLYQFCAFLATKCGMQIPWTIENPVNSWMWATSWFAPLVKRYFRNTVDACEFGSDFKKGTTFLSNFTLPRLNKRCSNSHSHKIWNILKTEAGDWKFDASKEAEYPTRLAKAIALSHFWRKHWN